MNTEIRLEREGDHRAVEEQTREAFWNLYVPGADEHFLFHKLRQSPGFLKDLCFVVVADEKIVGSIIYTLSVVKDASGKEHQVITFGPVSVLPSLHSQGIGSKLVNHSLKAAADMGYKAVVIYGEPGYYKRFGFENGIKFGISAPDGSFKKALMVKELREGSLSGISGCFFEDPAFQPDQAEYEAFEQTFPAKEKLEKESQKRFAIMVGLNYDDPDV